MVSRPASDKIADPSTGIVTQVWRNALLGAIDGVAGPMPLRPFKVADLPDADKHPYSIVYVTDASGGACAAISDGSAWKALTLGATVS